jgi:hypothetical protein
MLFIVLEVQSPPEPAPVRWETSVLRPSQPRSLLPLPAARVQLPGA